MDEELFLKIYLYSPLIVKKSVSVVNAFYLLLVLFMSVSH